MASSCSSLQEAATAAVGDEQVDNARTLNENDRSTDPGIGTHCGYKWMRMMGLRFHNMYTTAERVGQIEVEDEEAFKLLPFDDKICFSEQSLSTRGYSFAVSSRLLHNIIFSQIFTYSHFHILCGNRWSWFLLGLSSWTSEYLKILQKYFLSKLTFINFTFQVICVFASVMRKFEVLQFPLQLN